MVTVVKLGGSVLTDPTRLFSFRREVAVRLVREIRQSGISPVIVYGTGRAGKAYARHYHGPGRSTGDRLVFQLTTAAIRQLGDELGRVLRDEGVAHVLLPANAVLHRAADGGLGWYAPAVLTHLLGCGVTPVLCGDVLAERPTRFGVVSSDEIVTALTAVLAVRSCVFATDVDGLYTEDGRLVGRVGVGDQPGPGERDRGDVTGGMSAKVAAAVAASRSGADVAIVNGLVPGRLRAALRGEPVTGTWVRSG